MAGQKIERTGLDNPKNAFAFVEFLIGQFAKTIVVFLRKDFGARYFNVSDILGATASFVGYLFLLGLISGFSSGTNTKQTGSVDSDSTFLTVFLLGFIAISIYHYVRARNRERNGKRWHSRYAGTSFLTFLYPADVYIVQRYIEPAIIIVAGYLIHNYFDKSLGSWLFFSGVCLAAIEQLQATRSRNRLLDAIDAQIEAQNLGAALAGNKTAEQTEGFVLPVPRYYSPEQRRALEDGMTRLDPALAAILDTHDEVKEIQATRKSEQVIENTLNPALQAILDTPENEDNSESIQTPDAIEQMIISTRPQREQLAKTQMPDQSQD